MRQGHERPEGVRMERMISLLLRVGVVAASALVLAGGLHYLHQYGGGVPHYGVFQGEPASLRTLGGILGAAAHLDSRALIQFGLLLLILTPVARVVFSVAAFALQRDRLYVCVTLLVLAVLLYNLRWPH
jgi:uncharacterized membrane protein